MIVAMNKLYLLIHHRKQALVMEELQRLGVVHINQKEVDVDSAQLDELLKYLDQQKKIESLFKYFSLSPTAATSEIPVQEFSSETNSETNNEIEKLLDTFQKLITKREQLAAKKEELNKTYQQIAPWGNYSLSTINKLREQGVYLDFFVLPEQQFLKIKLNKENAEKAKIQIEIINKKNSLIYFVVISRKEETKLTDKLLAGKISLPIIDVSSYQRMQTELEDEEKLLNIEINKLRTFAASSSCFYQSLLNKIAYQNANLNLTAHENGAFLSLVGWFPQPKKNDLLIKLDALSGVAYLIDEKISEQDIGQNAVPVLLKNNKIFSAFEPITKLFDLPNYYEFDLTPFFAPFFVIFFGLCVGDSGYGLVLLLISSYLFFTRNPKVKALKLRPFAIVGILFSLAAIFWGTVSGNIFGVDISNRGWPLLSSVANLKAAHIFYLSLMVGLLQILFGMVIQTINKCVQSGRLLAGASQVGWIILVCSLTSLYLRNKSAVPGFVIGEKFIELCKLVPSSVAETSAILGVILILFFNDLKANIFVRLGKGLWELYGITGVFGDLLSYIRLFALGISSSILGAVINSIGMQFLKIEIPLVGEFLMIIFLLLGHTGNIFLSCLGSFVHPLRLTFVEFYKNAGFAGGGRAYAPFRRYY